MITALYATKDVILEYESFTPNIIAHAKCVIFFKLCYTCKYIYPAISTFAVQILLVPVSYLSPLYIATGYQESLFTGLKVYS
jgi:uncharacterized membrane protein